MAELGMRFDDVLKNLTGQAGSLEALLRVFFSFLHRNTDFYVTYDPAKTTSAGMGFPPGKAEQLLLRAFKSFPYKEYGGQQQQQQQQQQPRTGTAGKGRAAPHSDPPAKASPSTNCTVGRGGKPKAAPPASHAPEVLDSTSSADSGESRTTTPPSQQQAPSGSGSKDSKSSSIATCREGSAGLGSSSTPAASDPQTTLAAATASAASESNNNIRVRYTDSGLQVPIGNGGVTPKYYWTQTVTEATVYVDVPPGTRSKDISCLIQPRRLKLRVKGAGVMPASTAAATAAAVTSPAAAAANGLAGATPEEDGDVIIDGELPSAVSREDSMWSLNDGKTVVISFEKATRSWWKSVVEGDPEIDTSKVSHSASTGRTEDDD